jgi:RNA polymerase sigma-54 factor
MKPGLQVRMSQHLALTPQLQQSIRLLQLSTLELHQELGQMLDQNPFLELEDDTPNAFEASLDAPAVVPVTTPVRDEPEFENPVQAADDGATADLQASDFGTTERDDWSNGTEGDDFDGIRETPSSASAASGGDDDFERDSNAEIKPSLQDHLHAQARTLRLSREDHCALGVLIESLDESGYLADALEDLVPALGALVVPESEEELLDRLRCALQWLHTMEPLGVGARSLGECLCLQLRQCTPNPERELALVLCSQHLELLAKRDTKRMMAATGADEEDLRYAHALILTCDPKPGRAFSHTQGQVVVPDVIVLRSGRGLKVSLNPDVMPKLRINDLYAQALRSQRGASGSPMGAQLQEARWFMKNVQQRFDTILRVAGAIVERQKNFFIHGEIAMKPLVLREIADELGLHESTISRVTTAKYLASPIGTFELKYFFGSSLNTDAGGNASSTAVRALIKQFVGVESPAKPLSDSQLSLMLEEQGIQVARRTVAKYREALKIAPANLRKAV